MMFLHQRCSSKQIFDYQFIQLLVRQVRNVKMVITHVINVCLQTESLVSVWLTGAVVTAQCYHLDLDTLSVTSIIFMDTTPSTLFSITQGP